MLKEWYSAQELADLIQSIPCDLLPNRFPQTKAGIIGRAKKFNWASKPRKEQGGGTAYHISNLPETAVHHISISIYLDNAKDGQAPLLKTPVQQSFDFDTKGLDRARRDAKLTILSFYDDFKARTDLSVKAAEFKFAELYNARKLSAIPDWIYQTKKTISAPSLARWRSKRGKGQMHELAGNYGHRKGSGVLDNAEGGKVAEYIAVLIVKQPHLSADNIRDLVLNKFGNTLSIYSETTKRTKTADTPPIRTFQRFISTWKAEHAEVLMKMTDPDAWKNKYKFRGENMNHWVKSLNQLWEIDASPADAMLNDGRYSIYAVIDIYSRRMMVSVTKTPTTAAVLLLLRKAILAWGVPTILRTDNGADFTSYEFVTALHSLGIQEDLTDPFSPEQKASVERTIGTLQRGFMPLLPGFIGHDVADRKKIEARKTFAQRLGEKDEDIFCAELSSEQFQQMVDDWCELKYAHKPHSGIENSTPFQRAANWTAPIRRIENERALDLLLAPIGGKDGYRTITAKGIRLDNARFMHPNLQVGERVFIRHDPDDMGRIYVFSEERHEFICVAECPERLGINPGDAVRAVREEQARRLKEEIDPLRREIGRMKPTDMIEGVLNQARRNSENITAFPKASTEHLTPDLAAAAEATASKRRPTTRALSEDEQAHVAAVQADLAKVNDEKVVSLPETPKQRFKRAVELQRHIEAGDHVDPKDAKWLGGYENTSEYRAYKGMLEDFGTSWLEA